ncbi:MAG: fibronectin type III domain-containing protein, partial [Deltaproteobacteria bacterium]|nr:fibronectin type III domain-containing protein [Deltaproteobacteria bacterium]
NKVNVSLKVRNAVYYALREDTQFGESDWKEFIPDANNEMIIPYTLSEGDGVKTLYAMFKDIIDNKSVLVFDSVTVDTIAPSISSFDIAGGSRYTKSLSVNIGLNAIGAYEMKISCDGINYTDWMVYTGSYVCTLPSGDGLKTLKAVVRDQAGNLSEEKEASIELDTTPPAGTSVVIRGKKKDMSGNDTEDSNITYTANVLLELEAEGATKIAVSSQLLDCSTAVYDKAEFTNGKFISEYRLDGASGQKKVYVCFTDEAGNYTTVAKTASIYLDTQAPMGLSFILNNGNQYTNTLTAKIDMIRLSDDYNERYVKFSNCDDFAETGCNTTGWLLMPLNLPYDWQLTDGDGTKYVYMKARDGAGNESSFYYAGVVLDTIAPSNAVVHLEKKITNEKSINVRMNAEGADMICVRGDIIDPCDPSQPFKWRPFVTSMQVELLDYLANEPPPNGEVMRKISVDFMDKAGNITTETKSIIYDRVGPLNPSVQITGYINDILTGKDVESTVLIYKPNVNLTLKADFANKVSISTEPNLDCDTANYMPVTFDGNTAVIKNFGIGMGTGDRMVFVCFSDEAGNVSKKVFDNIYMDIEPPKNLFFMINNGAEYSTSKDVTLNQISAFDNYSSDIYIMISNEPDFKKSTGWIKLINTYAWKLTDGEGNKQVYLKARDYAGNESAIFVDNIILDTVAPGIGNISVNNGADYTNSLSVNVLMNVTGDVYEMRVACDGTIDSEPWLVYSNVYTCLLPPGDGNKTIRAIFRDKAGNLSVPGEDTIMLDTKAPSSPRIGNQSQVVDSNTYTITLTVTSSDPAPSSGWKYQCKDYSADWYDCTFSSNQRVFTLAQDKVNRLGVRAVDNAGNISSEDYVEIIEDSIAPQPPGNIKVIEGNTRALIRWQASLSDDVKGYKLYYGPTPDTLNGTFATEGPSPIDVGNRLDFGLSSLVNGSTFYVTVTAYDKTEVNGPHE